MSRVLTGFTVLTRFTVLTASRVIARLKVLTKSSAVIILLGLTTGCNGDPAPVAVPTTEINGFVVDGVNDYSFLFNATEPGAVVNFHSQELTKCSLSFIAKKFAKGYQAKAEKLGDGEVDLTCFIGKDHYALSPISPTHASMDVLADSGEGKIALSFLLFNVKKKASIEYKDVTLNLTKSQTRTLAR